MIDEIYEEIRKRNITRLWRIDRCINRRETME